MGKITKSNLPVSFSLLIVGTSSHPETFLARLIKALIHKGIHITLASSRKPKAEWCSHPNFTWLHSPNWRGSIFLRLARFAKMALLALFKSPRDTLKFLTNSVSENGLVSIVHSLYRFLPFVGGHWDMIYFPWNSAAITYLPLFGLESSVILSCRGSQVNIAPHNPKRYSIREGLRTTFSSASAVHCVSDDIKQEAMKYGLDASKAWLIRPAVDPDFFHPPKQEVPNHDSFRIITTGSLIWRKGYEYALLAIRHLIDNGVPAHFGIIGDGIERQRVLYTIHDLGLEEEVELYGRVSPQRVLALLQQADVFLLSSLSEGISNAVLEAMSCGLPVVTTDCGGMREAVTDGVEGFVVPVRDVDAIAQALQKLWEKPALRVALGSKGRHRVLLDFSLNNQVKRFIDMFEKITAKAKK